MTKLLTAGVAFLSFCNPTIVHAQAVLADTLGPAERTGSACDLKLSVPLVLPQPCQGFMYTLTMTGVQHSHSVSSRTFSMLGPMPDVPVPYLPNRPPSGVQGFYGGSDGFQGASGAMCIQETQELLPHLSKFLEGLAAKKYVNVAGSAAAAVQKADESVIDRTDGAAYDILLGKTVGMTRCVAVAAYIPARAEIVGVRAEAFDTNGGYRGSSVGWHPCEGNGQDCRIGFARFEPIQSRASGSLGPNIIYSTFVDWSHNTERYARVIVVYKLPSGSGMPHPL